MYAVSREQTSLLNRWAFACVMTGVTALGARLAVSLPMTPVPLTFQVFAVLLSGLVLGSRFGALAQMQYLMLGAFNLPVFAQGHSGTGSLFGITGGYLLSYPIAAFVTGWFIERKFQSDYPGIFGSILPRTINGSTNKPFSESYTGEKSFAQKALAAGFGLAVIYGIGCVWFAFATRQPLFPAVFQGVLVFIAWDLVKVVLAIGALDGVNFARRKVSKLTGKPW